VGKLFVGVPAGEYPQLHFNGPDKRTMPAHLCKLFGWEFVEGLDVGAGGVTGRLFLDAR
jgi:hypothetical protein